jgi:hypothetical protein
MITNYNNYQELETLYKNSLANNIIEYLPDGYPILLDKNWPLIGINCSGGADSTMLTYLICSLIKEKKYKTKVVILNHIRWWDTKPWQDYHGTITYEYLKNEFDDIITTRYQNLIPPILEPKFFPVTGKDFPGNFPGKTFPGGVIETINFDKFMTKKLGISAIYAAINRSPKLVNFENEPNDRVIDIDTLTEENAFHYTMYKYDKENDPWFISPIAFVDKRWTVEQYITLRLENLLDMTRSCEGDVEMNPEIFKDLDYTTYTPGDTIPVCKTCYWCLEREWGISHAFKK